MKRRHALAGLVVAGGVLVSASGVSGAAPDKFMVDVTCDGTTYAMAGNGSGWSPVFVEGTKTKFFPTAFENFTGVEYDDEGNPGEPFTEEFTDSKGAPAWAEIVDCTFEFTEYGENGLPVFTGSGGVSGYFK